jgi:hypothetical protein
LRADIEIIAECDEIIFPLALLQYEEPGSIPDRGKIFSSA